MIMDEKSKLYIIVWESYDSMCDVMMAITNNDCHVHDHCGITVMNCVSIHFSINGETWCESIHSLVDST